MNKLWNVLLLRPGEFLLIVGFLVAPLLVVCVLARLTIPLDGVVGAPLLRGVLGLGRLGVGRLGAGELFGLVGLGDLGIRRLLRFAPSPLLVTYKILPPETKKG